MGRGKEGMGVKGEWIEGKREGKGNGG